MPSKRSMEMAKKFIKEMADQGFTWYEAFSVGCWIKDILQLRQKRFLQELPAKSVLKDGDYEMHDENAV